MALNRRFTLIELLVVVTIIAILASMLLPALARARFQARLSLCIANQKQQAMAITSYTMDYDDWYPFKYHGSDPTYSGTYQAFDLPTNCPMMFPYLGLTADPDEPSWKNKTPRMDGVMQCPQGMQEVAWLNGGHAHSDWIGFYNWYVNFYTGLNLPTQSHNMMRKVGDTLTIGAAKTGSHVGMEFNILGSDVTRAMGTQFNHFKKNGISTNHIWGGEKLYSAGSYTFGSAHFSTAPLYWVGTGQAFTPYTFDDGHVEVFGPTIPPNFSLQFVQPKALDSNGASSGWSVPIDFAL